MGAPKKLLEAMRDDTHVLALVAATDEAPFTMPVIEAVARWFGDVEIRFPIADMGFSDAERREIVRNVSNDLLAQFNSIVGECVNDVLDEERFAALAASVDPLWRELAGAFAAQLNERFEENRVPTDHSSDFLTNIMSKMEDDLGDDAVNEFRRALSNDSNLRAQLRRMGLDPDAV